MAEKTKAKSFESSLKALEKVVNELEKGEMPLEAQLKAFEKGVAYSRECMERLNEVEKRVETLVESVDGDLQAKPLDGAT